MNDPIRNTILSIDDDEAVLISISSYLEDCGFKMFTAKDGFEGIEVFEKTNPELVLVDLRMPEVDGLDVIRYINRQSPDTPIIVVSGTGVLNDAIEAIRFGACDYLTKPIENLSVLLHTVKISLERARLKRENLHYQLRLEQMVLEKTDEIRRLSAVVEQSIDGCIITDIDENIIYSNPAIKKLYGYTPEMLSGKSIFFLSESFFSADLIRKELIGIGSWEGELNQKKADGSVFPAQVSFYTIKDPKKGECVGYATLIMDITEQKKSEAELKQSEQRFRELTELLPEIVFETDNNLNITFLNVKGCNQLGYKKEDIGKYISLSDIIRENEKQKLFDLIKNSEISENESLSEFTAIRKDGSTFPVLLRTVPVYKEQKKSGTVGLLIDITLQKIIEKKLLEAKEKAEEASLLKNDFLSQVSHEIRTPMSTILSYIHLIEDEMNNKEFLEYFISMNNAGNRIVRTINLILDMAQFQKGTYEPIYKMLDLNSRILKNIFIEYKKIANAKGIEFLVNSTTDDYSVYGDEYTIGQMFQNIVDNSVKFTVKGRVEIFTSRDENGCLSILVKDSGIGISEKYLKNIYNPFSQEERGYCRKYDGIGLGMSLVKEYCQINKAKIKIESRKGIGTNLNVLFSNKNN